MIKILKILFPNIRRVIKVQLKIKIDKQNYNKHSCEGMFIIHSIVFYPRYIG